MLVDGKPRVSCVTPVGRVAGRDITTVDGLPDAMAWADAFTASGASQCGFCTPGIIVRVAAMEDRTSMDAVHRALAAHLCRCTGWRTIVDTVLSFGCRPIARHLKDSSRERARLEGGSVQEVGAHVALGRAGFADDTAPEDALVAARGVDGEWHVAETLTEARRMAGKVQGRRSTAALTWPIDVPPGDWDRTLQTTWVEPGYLEPDASWCAPGGAPVTPLANGGAFGGKVSSEVTEVARRLADRHGRAVRVLYSREDIVRLGPKRPPIAAGVRADGTGTIRVVRTPGIAGAISRVWPELVVEQVDVSGPPTSCALRAAGWAEAAVLHASLADAPDTVTAPNGSVASARVDHDGVHVHVRCGDPLDEVVLRSYCTGAAHMALGWVRIGRRRRRRRRRSCRPDDPLLRHPARADTPAITVDIEPDDAPPVNGSDAVFAAVAAAAWLAAGYPPRWPVLV